LAVLVIQVKGRGLLSYFECHDTCPFGSPFSDEGNLLLAVHSML
jgi:hypothetical protein